MSETLNSNYAVISSVTIFLGNIVLLSIAQPIVSLMGFNHRSSERVAVSFTIFMSFMLNSFVMPILLQANFSADYTNSFWDLTFSDGGRNSDFGPTWYTDIGTQLTINLILLSILPLLIVFYEMAKLRATRYMNMTYWYREHDNNHVDNIKGVVFFEGPFGPIPSLEGIPEWFVPNMLGPQTAEPTLLDDNWLVECFLLDPACGATSRSYTEAEKEVYRAPWTTREEREQILLWPQYLPFADTTGHPVLDPDGPGGEPPQPAPEFQMHLANADWLATADVPKRFLYGMPGTWAGGNAAPVAAGMEASMLKLTTAQVGRADTPNYHYIAEDTPEELAQAVVDFVQEL